MGGNYLPPSVVKQEVRQTEIIVILVLILSLAWL